MTWCFNDDHDNTPTTQWGLVCSCPCCCIPSLVSQESPWAVPSDQHSHECHQDIQIVLAVWFWSVVPCWNRRSLTCKTAISHLCGGLAAGCCFSDVMTCWLALRQKIHRGIFNMCRSTWPRLLQSSVLSWIRKLDCLCFHKRQHAPFPHAVQYLREHSGSPGPATMMP